MMKNLVRRLLAGALAIAAGLTIALAPAGADWEENKRKEYWQKRYAMVLTRQAVAQERIENGRKAVRKARQRDRLKGERRTQIMSELENAERELATVLKLLAEFPDSARQAGVPPGWLREVEQGLGS